MTTFKIISYHFGDGRASLAAFQPERLARGGARRFHQFFSYL
jgi:hypothetical protein